MSELPDSDDLKIMVDVGFVAASRGLVAHAEAIFQAVEAMRPRSEAPAIGLAMVDLAMERPQAAVERLNRAVATPATRAFLGLALMRAGDKDEARAVVDQVLASGQEHPAMEIARAVRAELETMAPTGLSALFITPQAKP